MGPEARRGFASHSGGRPMTEIISDRFPIPPPSAEWTARNPDWQNIPPDDPRWNPDRKDPNGDLRKQSARNRFLPVEWFHDIVAVLLANDFVGGVLAEGSAAVVFGESNSGKSFWTLDLALHVASGKPWNGRRVTQGGVLYVAMEGERGFRNRVAAWRDHMSAHNDEVLFAAVPVALNLRDATDAEVLIQTAKEAATHWGQPVRLIVIDTVSRALAGGDENGSVDMGDLVRSVDTIRKETGACLLLIHHSGKDASRGARGHSLLRAAVDSEIEIKASEDGTVTATITKQRDLEKGGQFGFRLDRVTLGQNQYGEDVTTAVVLPTEAPTKTTTAKPARALNPEAMTLKAAIIRLVDDAGERLVPEPDAAEVKAISRKALQDKLVRDGWLRTVSKPVKPSKQAPTAADPGSSPVSGDIPPLSEELSVTESVPDSEHSRLWKRLNDLKEKENIGYNKNYVWMIWS